MEESNKYYSKFDEITVYKYFLQDCQNEQCYWLGTTICSVLQ